MFLKTVALTILISGLGAGLVMGAAEAATPTHAAATATHHVVKTTTLHKTVTTKKG